MQFIGVRPRLEAFKEVEGKRGGKKGEVYWLYLWKCTSEVWAFQGTGESWRHGKASSGKNVSEENEDRGPRTSSGETGNSLQEKYALGF